MNPKISIIIPVHNDEKYIAETLNSVLLQTEQNFQLIVVDDHSTDESLSISREFKKRDKRIEVYKNPSANGVSVARNFGLLKAQGEYVVFIDGDDLVEPTYISHLMKNIVPTGCNVIAIHQSEDEVGDYRNNLNRYLGQFKKDNSTYQVPSSQFINLMIRFNGVVNGSVYTKIFNRHLLEEHGINFNTEIAVGEDFLFCISYLKYTKCVNFYDEQLYIYRRNANSIMRSKNQENYFNKKWISEVTAMKYSKSEFKRNSSNYNLLSAREAFAAGVLYKRLLDNDMQTSELLKKSFMKNYFYFVFTRLVSTKTKIVYSVALFMPSVYKKISRGNHSARKK